MRLMIRWQIVAVLALHTTPALAQKRQYTMAEAVNGLGGALAPKGVKGAQWRPGTHELYYRLNDDRQRVYNASNDDTALSQNYSQGFGQRKPGFQWLNKDADFYYINDTLSLHAISTGTFNIYGGKVDNALPKSIANLHVDPSTGAYAYTKENNLYYSIREESQRRALTSDTNPNILNGQAVHRNEFGIDNGIFFSPKGNLLAYYHMDQTMVTDYPVIDWSTIPAKNENVKYPMAGDSSHEVTLRVYNIATQKTIELHTEDGVGTRRGASYLTCVTWSPDEKYIYVGILNRGQNHLWLNKYSATTGERIKTSFEEKSSKYVEPQHPLSFIPNSNTKFIWWSQRDGYMHLWLCDEEKNTIKCLTPGDYVVNELIGFNKRTGEVLITSAKQDPREKHGYAVNWNSGKMRRLDTEPGTHTYAASDDGEYLLDVFSNETARNGSIANTLGEVMEMEPEKASSIGKLIVTKRTVIRSIEGMTIKVLLDSPDPIKDFDRPIIISQTLKAADGTNLYGRLILPTNFDYSKKYPVIVYLYNGPHVQLVKNAFPASGNLWYEYMAQHGYIVCVMDGRGSSNRGLKFEQATFQPPRHGRDGGPAARRRIPQIITVCRQHKNGRPRLELRWLYDHQPHAAPPRRIQGRRCRRPGH